MRCKLTIPALLILLSIQSASAQIPQTMGFQGVLRDASGSPVADGIYGLTFRLYDTTGTEAWSETQGSVAVVDGVFAAILGSVAPLNIAFDQSYELGISVGADPEMSPRTELASSPYALMSGSVVGGAIGPDQLAEASVTAGKIATASVGMSQLIDGSVNHEKLASPLMGIVGLYKRQVDFSINSGQGLSRTASCDPGDMVLAGGHAKSNTGLEVGYFGPTETGDGWTMSMWNPFGTTQTASVLAWCADLTP